MTLPTPKLDDRRFQDLVDEAKRRVQEKCPEWTNHNVSDPGVTLIETFAWMTDQLLYRLNRVPDLNYLKFLELLGVTLQPPTAATVDLTFWLSKAQENVLEIPAMAQVSTVRNGSGQQVTFATTVPLPIVPCSIAWLASVDHLGNVRDRRDAGSGDTEFVCFGDPESLSRPDVPPPPPRPGDAFLVGLNEAVPSCAVKIHLDCKKGEGGGISDTDAPLDWDASVGEDRGTVHLWNAATREELDRFTDHGAARVKCVALGPDGHKLASVGEDGTVRLRDIHDQTKPTSLATPGVRGVAFSPDGKMLATAGEDGILRLWDADTHDPIGHFPQRAHGLRCVAFSLDGQMLASGEDDGAVRLYEYALDQIWVELRPGAGTYKLVEHAHDVGGYRFALKPEAGTGIAINVSVSPEDSTDAFTLKVLQNDRLLESYDSVSTQTGEGKNNVVDMVNKKSKRIHVEQIGVELHPGAPKLSERPAYALGGYSFALKPEVGITIEVVVHENPADVFSLKVVQNGDLRNAEIYDRVSTQEGKDNVIDMVNKKSRLILVEPVGGEKDEKEMRPEAGEHELGGRPIVLGGYSFALRPEVGIAIEVEVAKDSADVFTLKVLQNNRVVERYDSVSQKGEGEKNVVETVRNDSKLILIQLEEPVGGEFAMRPKAGKYNLQENPVHSVAFSTDGKTLASAGDDGTVRLWDAEKREPLGRFVYHTGDPVRCVAFRPDDATNTHVTEGLARNTLASGGDDGNVRLWDLSNLQAFTNTAFGKYLETGAYRFTPRVLGAPITLQVSVAGESDPHVFSLNVLQNDRLLESYDSVSTQTGADKNNVVDTVNNKSELIRVEQIGGAKDEHEMRPEAGEHKLETAQKPGILVGSERGGVHGVAFSADGEKLATVGDDWTLRLWNVNTHEQLGRPLSDSCPVYGVTFVPSRGKDALATAGWDGGWEPCEIASDTTKGLNEAADVILLVPRTHKTVMFDEKPAGWLRCRVRAHEKDQTPYDQSPKIEGKYEAETVGGTVLATNAEIVVGEVLGVSDGTASQRFLLDRRPVVPMPWGEERVLEVKEERMLEVKKDGEPEEWNEVPSFADSGEDSLHFMLDPVRGEVVLGPAVRASRAAARSDRAVAAPPAPSFEIRHHGHVPGKGAVLSLRKYLTGGGSQGNVSARSLTVLREPIANVASVENRRAAAGGVDGEDIEDAKLRGPITLRTGDRAVTPEDYEQLAREVAPELARVECIPATLAGEEHAGTARVLVVPKVDSNGGRIRFEDLVPGVDLIDRITRYLERRRVIGVRVEVGPPDFRGFTVVAKLVALPGFDEEDVKTRVLDGLYRAFSPISGGRDGKGWEFGRDVLETDVRTVLGSMHGVDRVEDCKLFNASPETGVRTPADSHPGEPSQIVLVSRHATVFSYRHYVLVKKQ